MAKALAPSLELCKCAEVRAALLSYLTRRPALRGKRARWSGWPALDERKRTGGAKNERRSFGSGRAERQCFREPERSVHKYVRSGAPKAMPCRPASPEGQRSEARITSGHLDAAPLPTHGRICSFEPYRCSTTRLNNAPTPRTITHPARRDTGTIRMHTT